ncbi:MULTISPECIES: RICIN domain-containing protein [unclassified Streptomyces]|uniref:RICIN domain-containing protein n=1 Tax=Streptomyces TaxID=1883 RepID=UPI0033A19BBE
MLVRRQLPNGRRVRPKAAPLPQRQHAHRRRRLAWASAPATAETWARYALDSWTHGRVRRPGQPQSGRCLDATGPSSADATRLQIWDSAGSANQKWALPADPPGGHRPTPGVWAGDSTPPAAGRDVRCGR